MSSTPDTPDQEIIQGDCIDKMQAMDENSVHAVVTDPPYGLAFMGRTWDQFEPKEYQEWCEQWASEALRVLKPGGHLVAFSGNRTHHRLFSAVEDAGFEIRDTLTYHYGTGFPKGSDVSKYMDKAEYRLKNDVEAFGNYLKERREEKGLSKAEIDRKLGTNTAYSWWEGRKDGIQLPDWEHYVELKDILGLDDRFDELMAKEGAEREKVGEYEKAESYQYEGNNVYVTDGDKKNVTIDITKPATDPAEQWDGWRSQLKPATEFAVLARAPMSESAVYRNVLEHGTGALNIDRTRIPTEDNTTRTVKEGGRGYSLDGESGNFGYGEDKVTGGHSEGRYPANLLLDGVASRMLDGQSGECGDLVGQPHDYDDPVKGTSLCGSVDGSLNNLKPESACYSDSGGASRFFYTAKASKSERTIDGQIENDHPTVKPLSLMEWLVTLVTAPGQRVLDPFAGSGTTIMACRRLGRGGIGIEKDAEHAELARKRVELAHELETDFTESGSFPERYREAPSFNEWLESRNQDDEDDGPATLESFADADDD